MKKVIKWKKNEDGDLVSLDGFVMVMLIGHQWRMVDMIDDVKGWYPTQKEALDAGARQLMISDLGNFNVFLKPMEERGDLSFDHVIVSDAS